MKIQFLKTALAGLILFISGFASAGLIGDAVDLDLLSDGGSHGAFNDIIVGPGEEVNYFSNQFIDFGDMSFSVRSTSSFSSIDGSSVISWVLTDLDFGGDLLTGINFTLPFSNVSFSDLTGHSVTFSYSDVPIPAGTYFTAEFVTNSTPTVPEPSTLVIFVLGIIALVSRRFIKTA